MPGEKPEPNARDALSFLWGARVQRVDAPNPTLYALTLYDQGQKLSLIFALAAQPELGIVRERPIGQPASPFVRRLRVACENARLSAAHWLGGTGPEQASALLLSFSRSGESSAIALDLDPARPNIYLLGAGELILGAADERTRRAHFPGPKARFAASTRGSRPILHDLEDGLRRGRHLITAGARSAEDGVRSQARSQAKAAEKRLARKAAAIGQDLARAAAAPGLRREANLLLCHLGSVPPGAAAVTLEDISSEPVEGVRIELDPTLSAQQNAERRFTRARRLERGVGIASTRLRETEGALAALRDFLARSDALELPALLEEASLLGIKLDADSAQLRSRQSKGRQQHVPYRVFRAEGGMRILVGKGAADNDALTLTIARPHDLWLHARGLSGAHVIIPRERSARPVAPELLLDAAHLAAHFSDARGEPSAEVQYVERRYLRKPKGSAPGAVRVDRERVLLLRLELARLERLLASEERP
jgi:predicted ribosome quality control (RQC) complex YloA/Tae2 family protein